MAQEPSPSAEILRGPRPRDREAILRWGESVGIGHHLRAPLPWPVEHDLRLALYEARRFKTQVRCFADVLALDDLSPRSTLFELQAQLWSVAEETARVVAEHRARTTQLEAKPKPKSARLRRLVERLLEARAQLILELTRRRVPGKNTTLTLLRGDPPALRYTASPGLEGERRVDVNIQLSANATRSAGHLFSRGSSPPEALVEALDAALLALLDPNHSLTQEIVRVLDRPAWQTVLETLDLAPALQPPAPAREERLYWALSVGMGDGLTVELLRQIRGQRGGWLKPKRASWEDLDPTALPPEDARVLHALSLHHAKLHWSGRSPGRAHLMRALVGHPRVLGLAGEPVTVELKRAGLAVRERSSRISVDLAVDGQVLAERDPLRARILHDTEPVIAAVEPKRLSVIEVPPALRTVLTQLSKIDVFPPEAKDALLTRLSRVGQVVPLDLHEMPDRRVPARAGLIAQLEARGDGLELRFLVRPLPGGGSFTPGEGPPAVLGTDESGQLVVAERDRATERAALQALAERLSVTLDLSAPELRLAEAEAALETLERLRAEPNVELEWRTKPWQLRRPLPLSKLELQVADRRDWFGLAGGVELDGQRVQLALLLDAARRRSRYVKLADGEWAPFEDSLRRFLARLEGSSVTRRDELELTALALPRAPAGQAGRRQAGHRAFLLQVLVAGGGGGTAEAPSAARLGADPARLPEGGPRLALAHGGGRLWLRARGRHGAGQDAPGDRGPHRPLEGGPRPGGGADLGGLQLAPRAGALRTQPRGGALPRHL